MDSVQSNGTKKSEMELRREIRLLEQKLESLTNAAQNDGGAVDGIRENGVGMNPSPDRPPPIDRSPLTTTAMAPPEKSGYLFKWQDRSIGWGGTKWGLRFVRLERGRLSYYRSHEERSPRYVLTLKDCAVRDEGSKANKRHSAYAKRLSSAVGGGGGGGVCDSLKSSASFDSLSEPQHHEVGSHFHVFSIHQRPAGGRVDNSEEEDDIVPLLRFSTQSYAEKILWVDLISQACAYCDSEEFALARWERGRDEETQNKGGSRPKRGTLPKLVFEAPSPRLAASGMDLNRLGRSFRSKSTAKDAARSNKISYPPSKPMHRQASPSYLSPEGSEGQNYRGLFNLLMIILFVSNFHMLLDTAKQHGSTFDKLAALEGFWEAPLADFPFVSGLLVVQAFVVGAYSIEKMLSRGWVGERLGMTLHVINTNASLGVAMAIVWCLIDHPVVGAILIMHATITWLKLISYVHANYDYRATSLDKHKVTLALVKDLDEEGLEASYPENVTLGNIYYFWLAPTLTYQIAFPRSPFVRWTKVVILTLHLFLSATLVAFFAAQVVAPNLDSLVRDLEANRGMVRTQVIGDYLLKLSIASTYIWLLGFYGFFHCFLNLTAELLRFGDRVFYKDWWNASEVSAYWRLWNMPVHYWLVRHAYFPSIRMGLSKTGATFVVFFVSAVMHEVLISVPCHMVRVHSFLAMMGQMPLIFLTKTIDRRYPGSSVGNVIFWISFCFVGQPMAMLLYTIDYWEMHHQEDLRASDGLEGSGGSKLKIPFAAIGKFFGASSEL
mmetsp:Transcript_28427/g.60207  ORF Transcript_28427/g.60207 Transcript_28427/m.60207 type:complete len:777 (+) Transcript_28427:167-2497(+)